jgi:hypothetical protein
MADFERLVGMIEQIKVNQERMEALMDANLKTMETCLKG